MFKVNNKDTRTTSSKMERFAKIVYGKPLNIFGKCSIIDDVVLVSLMLFLNVFYFLVFLLLTLNFTITLNILYTFF